MIERFGILSRTIAKPQNVICNFIPQMWFYNGKTDLNFRGKKGEGESERSMISPANLQRELCLKVSLSKRILAVKFG
ncbi:hypothetical protein [Kaistella palustris]|uniref:hypothetical protein n=1 Tax=Kaistella palustris TaxID=493376 RepID=UPI0004254044|nr:hypothetical protein [Kaistella palustris]